MESIRYSQSREYISGSFYDKGRKYRIGYDFSSSFICIWNDKDYVIMSCYSFYTSYNVTIKWSVNQPFVGRYSISDYAAFLKHLEYKKYMIEITYTYMLYKYMEELVLEEGLFTGWQKCLLKIISVFPWS